MLRKGTVSDLYCLKCISWFKNKVKETKKRVPEKKKKTKTPRCWEGSADRSPKEGKDEKGLKPRAFAATRPAHGYYWNSLSPWYVSKGKKSDSQGTVTQRGEREAAGQGPDGPFTAKGGSVSASQRPLFCPQPTPLTPSQL